MSKLNNKVAVITGGNSGIGLATARAFVNQGAKVIITGRNKGANERAVAELGENAYALTSDTGKISDVFQLPSQLKALGFDKIDILFANAGVGKFSPIEYVTEEVYDDIFGINVKGVFFTIQQLLPIINDNGSIILNASVMAQTGTAGGSVYSAGKAALVSFARTLSAETVVRGIRVNTVSPGPIATPIWESDKMGLPQDALDQMAEGIKTKVPLKRFGRPEEVANLVVFLASDDSSFIVGEDILVDGGAAFGN